MSGKLYAIGVGPGAPDLVTVRAARLLNQLDIVYAPVGRRDGDSLALSIVREYLGMHTEVRTCHFPMSTHGDQRMEVWDSVSEALLEEVTAGKQVGFITLGDAMLFSTWVFLQERLGEPDWLEIIPGVTSFAAIAARAKFPLAMEQQAMAVVSCTMPEEKLEQVLQMHSCVVLMKVYGRFSEVKTLLIRLGLIEHALMMSEATLASEQCWRALGSVDESQKLPYFSTILVNKNVYSTARD